MKDLVGRRNCRHNKNWSIAGGYILWCYECGAIRKMSLNIINVFYPVGCWVKPTGCGGKNPGTIKFGD